MNSPPYNNNSNKKRKNKTISFSHSQQPNKRFKHNTPSSFNDNKSPKDYSPSNSLQQIKQNLKPEQQKRLNDLITLDLLTPSTVDKTKKLKETTINIIQSWQLIALNQPKFFEEDIKIIITRHYPCERRTVLDRCLVAFIFSYTEFANLILSPLFDLLHQKKLQYKRYSPPFYAIINQFSKSLEINPQSRKKKGIIANWIYLTCSNQSIQSSRSTSLIEILNIFTSLNLSSIYLNNLPINQYLNNNFNNNNNNVNNNKLNNNNINYINYKEKDYKDNNIINNEEYCLSPLIVNCLVESSTNLQKRFIFETLLKYKSLLFPLFSLKQNNIKNNKNNIYNEDDENNNNKNNNIIIIDDDLIIIDDDDENNENKTLKEYEETAEKFIRHFRSIIYQINTENNNLNNNNNLMINNDSLVDCLVCVLLGEYGNLTEDETDQSFCEFYYTNLIYHFEFPILCFFSQKSTLETHKLLFLLFSSDQSQSALFIDDNNNENDDKKNIYNELNYNNNNSNNNNNNKEKKNNNNIIVLKKIYEVLCEKMPFPNQWFDIHFLPILFKSIESKSFLAFDLLLLTLNHPSYSQFLFGNSSNHFYLFPSKFGQSSDLLLFPSSLISDNNSNNSNNNANYNSNNSSGSSNNSTYNKGRENNAQKMTSSNYEPKFLSLLITQPKSIQNLIQNEWEKLWFSSSFVNSTTNSSNSSLNNHSANFSTNFPNPLSISKNILKYLGKIYINGKILRIWPYLRSLIQFYSHFATSFQQMIEKMFLSFLFTNLTSSSTFSFTNFRFVISFLLFESEENSRFLIVFFEFLNYLIQSKSNADEYQLLITFLNNQLISELSLIHFDDFSSSSDQNNTTKTKLQILNQTIEFFIQLINKNNNKNDLDQNIIKKEENNQIKNNNQKNNNEKKLKEITKLFLEILIKEKVNFHFYLITVKSKDQDLITLSFDYFSNLLKLSEKVNQKFNIENFTKILTNFWMDDQKILVIIKHLKNSIANVSSNSKIFLRTLSAISPNFAVKILPFLWENLFISFDHQMNSISSSIDQNLISKSGLPIEGNILISAIQMILSDLRSDHLISSLNYFFQEIENSLFAVDQNLFSSQKKIGQSSSFLQTSFTFSSINISSSRNNLIDLRSLSLLYSICLLKPANYFNKYSEKEDFPDWEIPFKLIEKAVKGIGSFDIPIFIYQLRILESSSFRSLFPPSSSSPSSSSSSSENYLLLISSKLPILKFVSLFFSSYLFIFIF